MDTSDKLIRISLKFQPDVIISHGSIYASHAACYIGKNHISLEDTFNPEQLQLYLPFTKFVLTGDYQHPLKSNKVIKYAGYHELAYLHPKRFIPDSSVLHELGLAAEERYVIIRFVSWNASHDIGHKGISLENKIKAVNYFSRYTRVFISSESLLPIELQAYKIPISPVRIHDAIAYATLLFGESATMSEEACILGVPSIYLHNNSTYFTTHLEKDYELMYNFSESNADQLNAIAKGLELLQTTGLKEQWRVKKEKMLVNKIDVTAFLVWLVENHPNSINILKKDQDYHKRFR